MAKCNATTKNGQACKIAALKGDRFCFTHSRQTRAAQAAARKLGGQNRHTPHFAGPETLPADVTTLPQARQILTYTLAEVIGMDNSIARARVLLALFDSFIKSIEIGELEQRIAALEAGSK